MATKPIALRIPEEIYNRLRAYGLENFPKGDRFDISKTINTLLDKGLTVSGVKQPVNNYVKQVTEELDELLERKLDQKLEELRSEIAALKQQISEK